MRRTERLFQIIQILRGANAPVTGRMLADELEVSLRTLYRDMAELGAQRVPVTGEAGTGYVLDDGYYMPPLMLTPDELDAAALGASWVARHGDPSLARGGEGFGGKTVRICAGRIEANHLRQQFPNRFFPTATGRDFRRCHLAPGDPRSSETLTSIR